MRHFFLLAIALLFVTTTVFSQRQVHWSQLDNFHGKIFQRNHMEPFSGVAFDEHEPGKKKGMIPFKDGYMHGKAVQWDRHGNKVSETTYVMGKKQGREILYHENGKKQAEIFYENDKPHGMVIEYYDDGTKMSAGELINGTENGRYTWWYRSGKKDQELIYQMGRVNGEVKNWYENGQLKMVANFRSSEKQGTTTHWYENGKMMSKQHYSRGVERDTSSFWTKSGRLKEQKVYNRAGDMIDHMSYREASILTEDGYLHVFNKLGSNFTLSLKGETVDLMPTPVLAFYVDGVLVQIYTYSIDELSKGDEEYSIPDILKALKDLDIAELEAAINDNTLERIMNKDSLNETTISTDIKLDVTEQLIAEDGKSEKLFWKFPAPGDTAGKQLTLKEEQYLAVPCQNHVLLLNGMVFKANSSDEVKKALLKLSNQIKLSDKPIDVIDLSEQYQK